jgi:hypothetical protein
VVFSDWSIPENFGGFFLKSALAASDYCEKRHSHQSSNPVSRSVRVDVISKFQIAGATLRRTSGGEFPRSTWCRWNSLGGM